MKILALALGMILSAHLIGHAADVASTGYLDLIQSTNKLEREQSIRFLKAEREKKIRELLATMEKNVSFEVKLDVAIAFGNYRAVEAADVLVRNIELEDRERPMTYGLLTDDENASKERPISFALEKIGSPAMPALIKHISSNNDPKITKKIASIISAIDGPDIARVRLKKAAAAEPTPEGRSRIQTALQSLDELKTK